MSLINDALKRAKDAQQNSPPTAPAPQLGPAEAAPVKKSGVGMMVPIIIVVCAIAGVFIVSQNRQKTAAREPVVEPKPTAPTPVVSPPKPPVQPALISTPAPVSPPAKAPALVPTANAPALKLQAIFYAPGRSTAIINGKTVRVGNTFRGYRVEAITEASATLVSGTETNVMTLDQ